MCTRHSVLLVSASQFPFLRNPRAVSPGDRQGLGPWLPSLSHDFTQQLLFTEVWLLSLAYSKVSSARNRKATHKARRRTVFDTVTSQSEFAAVELGICFSPGPFTYTEGTAGLKVAWVFAVHGRTVGSVKTTSGWLCRFIFHPCCD